MLSSLQRRANTVNDYVKDTKRSVAYKSFKEHLFTVNCSPTLTCSSYALSCSNSLIVYSPPPLICCTIAYATHSSPAAQYRALQVDITQAHVVLLYCVSAYAVSPPTCMLYYCCVHAHYSNLSSPDLA